LTESKLYENERNVVESLSYAEDIEKIQIINKTVSSKPIFGISNSSIIENTFVKDYTVKDILRHMRNALSHPVAGKSKSDIPQTGFYSTQNETIEKIIFVEAPDSDRFYPSIFHNFEGRKERIGFPKNAILDNRTVLVDGKAYRRYIKIEL
jgi:hypothetical protein